MIDKQIIEKAVAEAIEGTDIFVVEIKVTPDNVVTVELDSNNGLDIDTCTRVTRAIHAAADPEVEDYELEVGSAGLTAPFKVPQQYIKNIGNEIEVLTRDGRKMTGRLVDVSGSEFTIEVTRRVKEPGAKRPVNVTEPVTLSMDNVKRAAYNLVFK